ncbi:MAG: hypothetical protein A2Y16_05505 [Tenericutes bacterium GWF2_57_13]|nr:MAG: hypothetical protein A2Y16_05505 [Tenericutes bacterium GWF2_57_13]
MQNKLGDLNNHLFETIERLNDPDITGEALEVELRRARAIAAVGTVIVNNGNLVLRAQKHIDEFGNDRKSLPDILQIEPEKKAA